MLGHGMQNRRFARPRGTGQDHQPFITLDPIDQMPKCLLVLLTPVQKTRVRRNIEGLFFQTIKIFIHAMILQ
jgi:hypothetical protein